MTKIIFLLPVSTDAYLRKRVTALECEGAQPLIFAFERDHYPAKPWHPYQTLGRISDGDYLKRIPQLLKAVVKVRPYAEDVQALYCFGLDLLTVGWLASRGKPKHFKLVYEVADIREILLSKGIAGYILRWLERFLLRYVDISVVTSQAYIDYYFHEIQAAYHVPFQVIENKLFLSEIPQIPVTTKPIDKAAETITIGYFGLIRCRRSWEVLKQLVKQGKGRFRVYIRGIISDSLSDMREEIRQTEHVDFGDSYIREDLPEMYSRIDLSWLPTYTDTSQLKWARTNRYYQACYFKRPMIAQSGTQDGLVVDQLGIGLNIDVLDVEGAVSQLMQITEQQLLIWQRNLQELPLSICVYTDEHRNLFQSIQQKI